MPRAAIGVGSNLASKAGSPRETVEEAVRRMGRLGVVERVSLWRETEPVGVVAQPWFVNGAVVLRTGMGAVELLEGLLAIEREMGRVRQGVVRRGPRTLDLDLLLYDELVMSTEELTVPHPLMHERAFVLEPLAEIAPEMRHTVRGQTVREMWEALRERGV